MSDRQSTGTESEQLVVNPARTVLADSIAPSTWFAALFLCIVTGGMTGIGYRLNRTNRALDDIESILEKNGKESLTVRAESERCAA
jgi:hypothetical protein